MATPKLSSKKRAEIIVELSKGGLNNREIAKKLRVSVGTVSNVKREGLTREAELAAAYANDAQHRRQYADAMKEITRLNTELQVFTAVSDHVRHFRPVSIVPRHGGKGEATAVICVNDWHYEEEVPPEAVNGVNEFNLDIAKKRVKKLFESGASLVDMCRSRSRIDTILVPVMGDLINGWLREESIGTNLLTPPEAALEAFDALVAGIDYLRRATKAKEIIVPCVSGNHGRITRKKWSKKGPGTSYEYLIYHMAARWFEARGINSVRFVLPQGDMTYITAYGKTVRITHGDNIRYCGGIGGVHIPLRKALDTWNTVKWADYNYIGHWHSDLTGEDYRVSGSLIGYNEFSLRIKARFRRPSQAFELLHPRYGATGRFEIKLD